MNKEKVLSAYVIVYSSLVIFIAVVCSSKMAMMEL